MPDFTLRNASGDPQQEPTFPRWIERFGALGFVRIGQVLPLGEPTESYLRLFGPEHVDLARRSYSAPTPILASPDREAFVEISEWFYGTPVIRLQTVLGDGSLVETLRRWDHGLQPTVGLPRHASFSRPIAEEMMQSHAPARGRSVRIADGDSAAEIWEAHLGHLAGASAHRPDASPARHDSIPSFIALHAAAHDHDASCLAVSPRSMARYWLPIALLPLLFALLAPRLGLPMPYSPVVATVGASLILAAGWWLFFVKVMPGLPFRRVPPWLRPRFRLRPPLPAS